VTDVPEPVAAELTRKQGDGVEPRPAALVTQELRLALAFTGGVGLAIWMGGVTREVDLLVQSRNRRRSPDGVAAVLGTPEEDPVRRLYRRLLDLDDVQVALDVLAGTSASGINASLLGLVNAWRLSLGPLREVWLWAGALDQLLREPREVNPASLLKSNGQLLTALGAGITTAVGARHRGRPDASAPGSRVPASQVQTFHDYTDRFGQDMVRHVCTAGVLTIRSTNGLRSAVVDMGGGSGV
jgi:hypothetical protein